MIKLIFEDIKKDIKIGQLILSILFLFLFGGSLMVIVLGIWLVSILAKYPDLTIEIVSEQIQANAFSVFLQYPGGAFVSLMSIAVVFLFVWFIVRDFPLRVNKGLFLMPLSVKELHRYLRLQMIIKSVISIIVFNVTCFFFIGSSMFCVELTGGNPVWMACNCIYIISLLVVMNTKVASANPNYVGEKQEEFVKVYWPLILLLLTIGHFILLENRNQFWFIPFLIILLAVGTVLSDIWIFKKKMPYLFDAAVSFERTYLRQEEQHEHIH